MAAVCRDTHERFRHEAGEGAELTAHLLADLAVRREVVGGLLGSIEAEVQLELTGRILVIALNHVEPHRVAVLDHLVNQRLKLRELVDVVAVGLRHALDRRAAVRVQLEPHHLGLGAGSQVQSGLLLELRLDALEVPATVGREEGGRLLPLLAVAEADAPDASGLRVPGKRHERLRLGNEDQLGGFRAVADVVRVAVGEEVRGRPVDELEPLRGHGLPVLRRYALAHDPAGDRDELVVDVLDSLGVDAPAHVTDQLVTAVRLHETVEVSRHAPSFGLDSSSPRFLRAPHGCCQTDSCRGGNTIAKPATGNREPRIAGIDWVPCRRR